MRWQPFTLGVDEAIDVGVHRRERGSHAALAALLVLLVCPVNPHRPRRHTYWTGFEVEIVYKGTLGPRAAVETVGDSASSCGIVFKEGKRYTVFARAQEDGLDTNICMGTTDGSIESRSYGLTAKPISSGETRFAPEGGIAWWLWMGIALGSVLLLGAGIAILGRHRSRVRGAGRFD